MPVIETIINLTTYFILYLYHVRGASLIAFFLLLLVFYILYGIYTKKHTTIPCMIATIPERLLVHDRKNAVYAKIAQYKELSVRPRLWKTLLPLVVAVAISYVLLNQMVFAAVVTSGSMEPVLEKYDIVIAQKLYLTPETGDIIVFEVETVRLPVIHRIISASRSGIKTKGDARVFEDGWTLNRDQIHGELLMYGGDPIVIKNIGRYILFDPAEKITITSKYGSEFYRTTQLVKYIKKMGLIIAIVCVGLYIYFMVTERR